VTQAFCSTYGHLNGKQAGAAVKVDNSDLWFIGEKDRSPNDMRLCHPMVVLLATGILYFD